MVLKQDVCSALGGIREAAVDIIFMDPPYDSGEEKAALAVLARMPYVTEDTLLVVEAVRDRDFSWVSELGFCITNQQTHFYEEEHSMKKSIH